MLQAEFPLFCTQPASEIHFAFTHKGLVFCYERERDFLSAPKGYVVLAAHFEHDILMTVGSCQMSDEQWETLQNLPFGIYSFINTHNENAFIFYSATQIIELQSATLEKITEIYHQPSTSQALIHFLGRA